MGPHPTATRPSLDRRGRGLENLRLSVTDRCNLRCSYCMPEETYTWLARERILTFEEIERLVRVFVGLGVRKVRLTGGEPLLRRGLDELVRRIASQPGVEDLAMTTNAVRLAPLAVPLRQAGLRRVTVSLDTLDPGRFQRMTGRDELAATLEGIDAALAAGFEGTKLNTVIIRGTNDDEIEAVLAFARKKGIEARFIEYMDVGGATHWSMDEVVPKHEILERIQACAGTIEEVPTDSDAPARRYRLADGTRFGIIASTTEPFCGHCNRSRLTADGHWLLCLYAREGLDLLTPLREGATDAELATLLTRGWSARDERGAEQRLEGERAPLSPEHLQRDPHLEMHTRGG
ncbi:MAG TPA: GTP 3',8-cyclase MoaA [Planctomycetes bacterium]|nr:GTP 3',8-cyclase MoaA [Planctomycetota bacterium]